MSVYPGAFRGISKSSLTVAPYRSFPSPVTALAGTTVLGLSRGLRTRPIRNRPRTPRWGQGRTPTRSYVFDICRTSSTSSLTTCNFVSQPLFELGVAVFADRPQPSQGERRWRASALWRRPNALRWSSGPPHATLIAFAAGRGQARARVVQTGPVSPASRAPRGKQSTESGRRSDLAVVRKAEEACDCPACSGGELDPEQMFAELVDGAADLAGCEDPLEAELAGALFVAMALAGGGDTVPAFAQAFIPAIEARGNDAALMMLTAIGAAACGGPEQVARAAVAAAGRLVESGVPVPAWAGELEQPLRVGGFTRLYDTEGTMSVLVGSFRRCGHGHAAMVM